MVIIYTTPGCTSCRKAKQWLKARNIDFTEKNIFATLLKENELKLLLKRSENGFDDLISKRSKILKENQIDIDSMGVNEFINFIQKNPSILKRPIIIDDKNILVGFDSEEIEVFEKAKNLYKVKCSGKNCPNYESCGYLREEE